MTGENIGRIGSGKISRLNKSKGVLPRLGPKVGHGTSKLGSGRHTRGMASGVQM